jgi:hypothetical protein
LFFVFYDIFGVQSFRLFYFHPPLPWSWIHILMLMMTMIPQIASLLLISVFFRWLSYFLEDQETIYCFSIFNQSKILHYDIYYQRDCFVTLVTCGYKSFSFSSYSYILWQPEFYSDCS